MREALLGEVTETLEGVGINRGVLERASGPDREMQPVGPRHRDLIDRVGVVPGAGGEDPGGTGEGGVGVELEKGGGVTAAGRRSSGGYDTGWFCRSRAGRGRGCGARPEGVGRGEMRPRWGGHAGGPREAGCEVQRRNAWG